jgi:hypothetical protein
MENPESQNHQEFSDKSNLDILLGKRKITIDLLKEAGVYDASMEGEQN